MAAPPASGLSRASLHRLGDLLRDAFAPHETDRFAALLGRLEAALADERARGEAAFRSELLAQVPALRRFAISLTHDPSAADDLVQDALLRAWRNRAGFAPGTNMEAWTFTILRNQFFTDRRKRGREVQDEDGARAARIPAAPEQEGRLDLVDVRLALARLPATMREALMLVSVTEVSYEEAAQILGCRLGTVKSRVSRARLQLARALGYGGAEVGRDALTLSAMGGDP